jgi:hypothetical protein
MNAKLIALAFFSVAALSSPVYADPATPEQFGEHPAGLDLQAPREMGEHPAVLVHRNWAKRGYDYASKMYRHPAGLDLYLEPPREMGEHPAVLAHRNWSKHAHDDVVQIASHPALSRFAGARPVQSGLALGGSTVSAANAAAQADARSTSER